MNNNNIFINNKTKVFLKTSRIILAAVLIVSGFFVANFALADATVTPASGGVNISIDTTSAPGGSGTYKTLSGPSITETAPGDISVGAHIIALPLGWEFDTSSTVTVLRTAGDIEPESQVITPDTNSFTFNVTVASTQNSGLAFIFSSMKVRPTGTTLSNGDMTYSGAGIAGVDGSTNFGTLSTVAGTVTQLAFITQPGGAEYGSELNPQPVVKTQDQFGNDSTSGLASNLDVTLALIGSGELQGTASLDIGTEAGNGTVAFSGLKVNTVGTKQLTVSADGLASDTSDNFEITQKPLTATITASDKVYDGTTVATITGVILDGVITDDDVTADFAAATASFDNENVGEEKLVSATGITIIGTDVGNYTFDGTATGVADIDQLEMTITPDADQTKIYGEDDPTFIYTFAPELIGDDAFTGALSREGSENVGSYVYTLGTLDVDDNYALTLVSETFEITQRSITVTAVTDTKIYDGTIDSEGAPIITVGSLAFSDTSGFIQAYDNKNVGISKTLTPTGIVNDGNGGINYNVSFVNNETGVITEKELTISGLSVPDKVYDGTTDAVINGTPVLIGVVKGDIVNLDGDAVGSFDSANVGDRTIEVFGFSISGDESSNYILSQPVLEATITVKPITVIPDPSQEKIYGEDDPMFSYIPDPALLNEDVFTGALGRAEGEDVGEYNYTLGNLWAGDNYSLTISPETFAIIERTLNVSASGVDKVYDADTSATVTLSDDRIEGDEIFLDYTAVFDNKNVATDKPVSVSDIAITGGADAGNYTLGNTTAETTADISPAALTATVAVENKVYDGNNSAVITGRTLIGVFEGDEVTANEDGIATFSDKNVGTVKEVSAAGITIIGADADNYEYDGTAIGTADITSLTLNVSATGIDKVYNANTVAEVTLSSIDIIEEDELIFGYIAIFADKNIGDDKPVSVSDIAITGGADAGNYTLGNTTAETTADISPAALTATVAVENKVYDGNTDATIIDVELIGVILGDDVIVDSQGTATFDTPDVSTGKAVTATGVTINGTDVGNYEFDNIAIGTGNILPIPTAVYVNDSWAGIEIWTDPDDEGPATYFGYDAFSTIQEGIEAVEIDGTVNVAAGIYNESLLIEKSLMLNGVEEKPVITGDDSVSNYIVKVDGTSNVVLSNLEVNGGGAGTDENNFAYGILVNDSDEVTITNSAIKNVWKNQADGINVQDSVDVDVYGNTISSFQKRGIRYLNSEGTFYGNEVIGDHIDGTARVQNLVNVFDGSSVEIYDNELHDGLSTEDSPTWDSPGIFVSSYAWDGTEAESYANIHDNEIYNCDSGIVVGSAYATIDTSTANITNNTLHDLGWAINFEVNTVSATIIGNSFTNNEIAVNSQGFDPIVGPIVDAQGNWWGSIEGPTHIDNPFGTGDIIANDNTNYRPWCTDADCSEIDGDAPTAMLSGTPNNPTSETTADITVNGDGVIYYKYELDSGGYNAETSVGTSITILDLEEGSHAISVIGRDQAGNWQSVATSYTWEVDATEPTLILVSVFSDNANSVWAKVGDTISLNFASSESIQIPTVTIAGKAAVVSGEDIFWTSTYTMTSEDAEGLIDFTIDFSDLAGNDGEQVIASTDASSVTFDKTAPVVEITDPVSDSNVNGDAVVEFTNTEETNPQCSFDGDTWDECVSGTTILADMSGFAEIGEGSFTLYLRDVDAAGNIGTDSQSLIKDTEAPTVESHIPSNLAVGIDPALNITVTFDEIVNISSENIILQVEGEDPVSVAVTFDDSTKTATINPDSDLADNSRYDITLSGVTDSANNVMADYGWSFTTAASYSIELKTGWNLISLPVTPTTWANTEEVLESINGNVERVWNYDAVSREWYIYNADGSPSNLDIMTAGHGYWVKMTGDDTLEGVGTLYEQLIPSGDTPPSQLPEIPLAQGWNLIGYYQLPGETTSFIGNALSKLDGAWSGSGSDLIAFNNGTLEIKTPITVMSPGEGYWIFMTDARKYSFGSATETD